MTACTNPWWPDATGHCATWRFYTSPSDSLYDACMPQLIRLERHGTTAVLTLDRPPAHALNLDLLLEVKEVIPSLSLPDVRAVVLSGQGRFFSAGLDLFEVFGYPADKAALFPVVFDEVCAGLFSLDLPIVAALNGHAVAGGAVLAAVADYRIASEGESQLSLSEIRVGVPFPTTALEIVRSAWSGPYFADLVYRGRSFRPAEALACHLIDEVVAPNQLMDRALSLAAELGSRVPLAFATTKRALRKDGRERMKAVGGPGRDPVWSLWRSEEILAAVEAYRKSLEKKRT